MSGMRWAGRVARMGRAEVQACERHRPRHRWENDNKTSIKEIGWEQWKDLPVSEQEPV